jgi:hypothetical protein
LNRPQGRKSIRKEISVIPGRLKIMDSFSLFRAETDVILSSGKSLQPRKVAIYGWYKSLGKPIQPDYSGHVYWYVDYSHGIRLMNKQVIIDGKPFLISDVLKDPVLFRLFSNEESPMSVTAY